MTDQLTLAAAVTLTLRFFVVVSLVRVIYIVPPKAVPRLLFEDCVAIAS